MFMKLQGENELERLLLGLLRVAQGYDVAECRALVPGGLTTADTLRLQTVLALLIGGQVQLSYNLDAQRFPWKVTERVTIDPVTAMPVPYISPRGTDIIDYTTPDVWWGHPNFVFTDGPDTPSQRAAREVLDVLIFRKYIPAVDWAFHLVYYDLALGVAVGGLFSTGWPQTNWRFKVLATGPSCKEVIDRLCEIDVQFLSDSGLRPEHFFQIRQHFPTNDQIEDDTDLDAFDLGMVL